MGQPTQSTTALASIWAAVLAISVLSPDLVSGSEQEHLPIAAFGTWLWGVVATRSVMSTVLRFNREGAPEAVAGQLVAFVSAVWLVAAAVAVFAPPTVTGSDPTRLPIAALVAPIAATVLTTGACEVAASFVSTRRLRRADVWSWPSVTLIALRRSPFRRTAAASSASRPEPPARRDRAQ